jgi:hypothetical protein
VTLKRQNYAFFLSHKTKKYCSPRLLVIFFEKREEIIVKMCKTTKIEPKHSMGAGIFSVAILFMLTGLGALSAKILNSPEHSEGCLGEGPALWAISNFYFSILGGGIGAVYELYLVLIGKIFESETIPVILIIRATNAGYIFSVGLIFVSRALKLKNVLFDVRKEFYDVC